MKNFRVVVQLQVNSVGAENEDDLISILSSNDNSSNGTSSSNYEQDNLKAEVKLIDFKTIQLNLIEASSAPSSSIMYKMTFDYVNYSSEQCFKNEISSLMDVLFLHQTDSCLLHFSVYREFALEFVYNNLITDINKRLQQLGAVMHMVKVSYRDILAEDVSKSALEKSHNFNGVGSFESVRELQMWLLKDYRAKWVEASGHEALEINFFILDINQQINKVSFVLLNIFLGIMDAEACSKCLKYIKEIGHIDNDSFVHSPLTACVNEYLDAINGGQVLCLFDVPTDVASTLDTVELLQMANAVIQHRNEVILKHRLRTGSNIIKRQSCPVAGPAKLNHSNKQLPRRLSDLFSKSDYQNLSIWYRKIDQKFSNVFLSIEKYFNFIYNTNTDKLCNDIENMTNNLEHFDEMVSLLTNSNSPMVVMSEHENSSDVVYNEYKKSLDDLVELNKEIECSVYSDTIFIYLETKKCELSGKKIRLNLKHLESCKQRLSAIINEKVYHLKSVLLQPNENIN